MTRASFARWKDLTTYCAGLDRKSLTFIERRRIKTLVAAFSTWCQSFDARVDRHGSAIILYNRSLASRALREWKEVFISRVYDAEQADVARTLFLKKRVLDAFIRTMAGKRQARWVAERNTQELRRFFSCESYHTPFSGTLVLMQVLYAAWLLQSKRLVIERSLLEAMQAKVARVRRLFRSALHLSSLGLMTILCRW